MKAITVREAKEMIPELDVYKFNRALIYLFVIKPQLIIGGSGINPDTVRKLKDQLNTAGIRGAYLYDDGSGMKIYELRPED